MPRKLWYPISKFAVFAKVRLLWMFSITKSQICVEFLELRFRQYYESKSYNSVTCVFLKKFCHIKNQNNWIAFNLNQKDIVKIRDTHN